MREAYRLHKRQWADSSDIHFLIGYVYIGSARVCDFKTIQEKVVASFHYLNKLYTQRKDQHDPS
jgi:hypothetical protein